MKVEIVRTLSRHKDENNCPYIDFWAVVSPSEFFRVKTVFYKDKNKLVDETEKVYSSVRAYLKTLEK